MLNVCHTNNMIKHQVSMDIKQEIKQKYPSTLSDQSNHHSIRKQNYTKTYII